MDLDYDTFSYESFLGSNISITVVSFAALVASVISSLKIGRQYRIVHALSIAGSLIIIVCEILVFISVYAIYSPGLVAASMFFNNIFPPLVWYLFFRIVYVAGEARLRYQDPVKFKKAAQTEKFVKVGTLILVAINLGLTIALGLGESDNYVYLVLFLFQYIANAVFVLQLAVHLVGQSYHRDVRPFAGSFYVVVLLLTCVSAGCVAIAVMTVKTDPRNLRGLLMPFMVRLAGSLALFSIVVSFQTVWMRHIRENQIRNDFMPGQPLNDENAWYPEMPYNAGRQRFI